MVNNVTSGSGAPQALVPGIATDRVPKPLRHVAMEAFSLVLSKVSVISKWLPSRLHCLFPSSPRKKRSIERGENHSRSDHVESFAYADGVIKGTVHASMKNKSYNVMVSA